MDPIYKQHYDKICGVLEDAELDFSLNLWRTEFDITFPYTTSNMDFIKETENFFAKEIKSHKIFLRIKNLTGYDPRFSSYSIQTRGIFICLSKEN